MSLLAMLSDPDPAVREEGLIFLSVERDPSVEELRALAALVLGDDSQRVREVAAQALEAGAECWGVERTVAALPPELLLPALADRSTEVRQQLLRVLGRYPQDGAVVAVVGALLGDPVRFVRIRAAAVVWTQTRDHTFVRPVIDEAIRSGECDMVVSGCKLLVEIGPAAADAVSLVWPHLRHPDANARGNAGYAVLKCCRDKRVLAEAAAILESGKPDSLVQYVAEKLRKESKVAP